MAISIVKTKLHKRKMQLESKAKLITWKRVFSTAHLRQMKIFTRQKHKMTQKLINAQKKKINHPILSQMKMIESQKTLKSHKLNQCL